MGIESLWIGATRAIASVLLLFVLGWAPAARAQNDPVSDAPGPVLPLPGPVLLMHAPSQDDPRILEQYGHTQSIQGGAGMDSAANVRRYRFVPIQAQHAGGILGFSDEAAVLAHFGMDPSTFQVVLAVPGGPELARSDSPLNAQQLAQALSAFNLSSYCGVSSEDAAALLAAARRNIGCAEAAADYVSEHPPGDPIPFLAITFARIFVIDDCAAAAEADRQARDFLLGIIGPGLVAEARDRHQLDDVERRLRLGEALLSLADDPDALAEVARSVCTSYFRADLRAGGPVASMAWIRAYAPTLGAEGAVGMQTSWQRFDDHGLEVGFEARSISHMAEYRRRLIVRRGEDSAATWLSIDTGGGDRVWIFATPAGGLVSLDAHGDQTGLRVGQQLEFGQPLDAPETWRYLGSFELVQVFNSAKDIWLGRDHLFVPAAVRGECGVREALSDELGIHGADAARECPRVRFDVSMQRFVPG
jgi:hypothetical protein